MRIIGLLGGAGSGKTTIAKYLETKYGGKTYTLATPLKQIVGRAFQLTDDQLYGSQSAKEAVDPRYNVSPRWLMQHIGTQGIRSVFGENFWVDYLLSKAKADKPLLAVCDDVRFINEAVELTRAGAVIWRVENLKQITEADLSHQSEAEWLKAPYHDKILNDGANLNNLLSQVDQLCYNSIITPVNLVD